ncbi:aldo/keto reductase [Microlunatus soli]|uniref:Aldo/keto reductase family protein n=1 Tax=Microlunatus soli TaxID=630515 RepID=A0A1H1QZF6_9ACTN|nr:aldo/keto reductase [Microlunatus soli]SDS28887.1 Aldo/keto reductase family protein [Microlunatus soli]
MEHDFKLAGRMATRLPTDDDRHVPSGRLVLGAAQFGQPYGNGPDRSAPSDRAVGDILDRALRHGVEDLDTARAYGDSEAAVGRAVRDRPGIRIVTKIEPLPAEINFGSSRAVAAAVRASADTSLAALGTGRVDTVLLHRARDAVCAHGAAVDELRALVGAGMASRWGVSLSTPTELAAVHRLPDLGYVQLPFNLLDRRWKAAPTASLLAGTDVHVTVRSALLQGLLVGSDPARWPTAPGVDPAAIIAELHRLASELGRTDPLELAIGYVLGHDWVDAVVLGLRRPDQLTALLDAVAAPPLDEDQIRYVEHCIPAGPDDLIDPSRWRFRRRPTKGTR